MMDKDEVRARIEEHIGALADILKEVIEEDHLMTLELMIDMQAGGRKVVCETSISGCKEHPTITALTAELLSKEEG